MLQLIQSFKYDFIVFGNRWIIFSNVDQILITTAHEYFVISIIDWLTIVIKHSFKFHIHSVVDIKTNIGFHQIVVLFSYHCYSSYLSL